MGTTLNRHAYQRLIDEDLAWLAKQPRSLERDHIEGIVRASLHHEYVMREAADMALRCLQGTGERTVDQVKDLLRAALHPKHDRKTIRA